MSERETLERKIVEDAYTLQQLEDLKVKVSQSRNAGLITREDEKVLNLLIEKESDEIRSMDEKLNHNPFYDEDSNW